MREFKFRAWDRKAKKMKYSTHFHINPNGSLYYVKAVDCNDKYLLDYELLNKDRYEILFYIGLKDKNEKEIYEGDIVKITINFAGEVFNKRIGVIRYSTIRAGYVVVLGDMLVRTFDDIFLLHDDVEIEVIGNIYENKELLRGIKNEG